MADISTLGNLFGSAAAAAPAKGPAATAAAPAPRRVPPPQPDGDVDLRLRNGRRLAGRIAPAVARREDLAAVAKATDENHRRTARALRRHRAAIADLRKSNADLTKKVEELERRANQSLGGLVPGAASLENRVRDLQALSVTTQIQRAGSVATSLQAAAYGDKGSLLPTNNLRLAGNQLFWTLLSPVLRSSGLVNASMGSVIAAAAPIATLVAGEILVGNRQQARFISGVTTFTDF